MLGNTHPALWRGPHGEDLKLPTKILASQVSKPPGNQIIQSQVSRQVTTVQVTSDGNHLRDFKPGAPGQAGSELMTHRNYGGKKINDYCGKPPRIGIQWRSVMHHRQPMQGFTEWSAGSLPDLAFWAPGIALCALPSSTHSVIQLLCRKNFKSLRIPSDSLWDPVLGQKYSK